ncbi:MAG TPA: type IV toxin-antitoxin system AbiEi family antitoxin domain-containing protein [Polyangiales bacterium]
MSASLAQLPVTFTYAQARAAGVSKHGVYRLHDEGRIERLARGVYRRADAELADPDLLEIATRAPRATLCLTTALARHGLSDEIPRAPDVALPRGTRTPASSAPVQWHHFDAATFDIGREILRLDADTRIGLYSAERSIIDAFRTRGHGGHELAHGALKRWLRRASAHPSTLLKLAARFPRAAAPLRQALEILL